jgi:hypothetical protein
MRNAHRTYVLAKQVEESIERLYRAVDNLPDAETDALLHPEADKLVIKYFGIYGLNYVTCNACNNITAEATAHFDYKLNAWVGRCCELPLPKPRDGRSKKKAYRHNR